jgi:uncharacterized membrane protein
MGVLIFGTTSLVITLAAHWRRQAPEVRKLSPVARVIVAATLLAAIVSTIQGWWTALLIVVIAGAAAMLLVWGAERREGRSEPTTLHPSSAFALLLIVSGLLLTGSVEFIFLRDTFGTRMNTVFKFYYQAWALLALASAYGAYIIVDRLRRREGVARIGLAAWSLCGAVLVAAGLSYTVAALASKTDGFRGQPTLDGTRHIAQWRPDDYAAIQWLRENAPIDAVMVEAPGGSYSEYNWVSAHTGIPTLLGWGGHELQWRGSYEIPALREPDIEQIYRGTDVQATRALLMHYGIDYVYVGRLERQKYGVSPAVMHKFDTLMDRVFEHGQVIIYGFTP